MGVFFFLTLLLKPEIVVGMKTKTVSFQFWEPFSRFYRLLKLNKNEKIIENSKNGKKMKVKKKIFERLPIVFKKYHIFAVLYCMLCMLLTEEPYSRTMRTHPTIYVFTMQYLYFLESHESWLIYPNPKPQPRDLNS
jgi:hypothetical protein